jgi:hypothetical protein
MKQLFCISLLLFTFLICYSSYKPGYLISNGNDTVIGLIKEQSEIDYSIHCFFKKNITDQPQEYLPFQIKGFRFINGKYFISSHVEINGEVKSVFFQWLIKSKVNILTYNYSAKNYLYYMQIGDSSLIALKNTKTTIKTKYSDKYTFESDKPNISSLDYDVEKKEYIGVLNYYLQDWPKIHNKLTGLSLNKKNLIGIAKDYQNYSCPGTACIIYEDQKWGPVFNIGIELGYNLSNVHTPYEAHIKTSGNLGFGILLNYSNLPLVSKNFSIQTGLFYVKQQYEYDKNYLQQFYPPVNNALFDLKVLRLPLILKYKFPIKQISPFIAGGLTIYYRKATILGVQYLIDKVINGTWPINDIFYSYRMGGNLQIGFSVVLKPNIYFEYNLCYERFNGFFGSFINDNSYNINILNSISINYRIN